MDIRIEESWGSLRTCCFTCDRQMRTDESDMVAYTDWGEELGRICRDCRPRSSDELRELLRDRAKRLRARADETEHLARGNIKLPTPEQLDALDAKEFVERMQWELERAGD